MNGATETRMRSAPRLAADAASEPASFTPLSARDAVARSTGIDPIPVGVARSPLWRSLGITGLVALTAAAALPLVAGILAIPF
ncbi:hypothetical protein [Microbacterium sp. 3J1]|uniref:hypothetical protein n=1 Tax=Microbacterium sp. 3J1 TaxID=861269 RepID=UPI000A6FC967|nr:hypothetical protein [Microbacterium sp. 3J1]